MNILETGRMIYEICPSALSEDWDNCGFQICFGEKEVRKVLVALEVTDAVIDEAVKQEADMILTHHPLLFNGIKAIDDKNIIGNHIIRLVQEQISVYSCHTDFDKLDGGNNDYFGKILKMNNISKIDGDVQGFCRKGVLPEEMTPEQLKKHLAKCLGIADEFIRVAGNPEKKIRECAWCTGAGSDFIETAFADGCQCYITGDLKYHEIQEADFYGRTVIDAGHYGTEKIFTPNMAEKLRNLAGEKFQVIESCEDLNPFVLL